MKSTTTSSCPNCETGILQSVTLETSMQFRSQEPGDCDFKEVRGVIAECPNGCPTPTYVMTHENPSNGTNLESFDYR